MTSIKALIFDLDGTLVNSNLSVDTYTHFGGDSYTKALYRLRNSIIDFHQFLIEGVKSLEGIKARDIEDFVSINLEKYLNRGVRKCIEKSKQKTKVGILTRNFWTYAKSIVHNLDIEYKECSHFEIIDGKITGNVEYECSKKTGIKKLSKKMRVGLDEMAHIDNDLPLEAVGVGFLFDPQGTEHSMKSEKCQLIKDLSEISNLIEGLP